MRTKPNIPPDGEQPNLPFLDSGAIPEFDEEISSLDDVDDLLREMADLPTLDDLLAESKANDQAMLDEMARQTKADIDTLLSTEERTASQLLGCYATRKARRRRRPRRKANS